MFGTTYFSWFILLFILNQEIRQASQYSNNEDLLLLYSTPTDIRITHTSKPKQGTVIVGKNSTHEAAIDFHFEQQKICWSDNVNETIQCATFDGLEKKDEIQIVSEVGTADGLACDWFTNKLYWTDSDTHHIEVVSLEKKHRKILFWTDIELPRAIALAPMKGLLFWTDWGEVPKIESAGMNGDPDTRTVIVSKDISWPNGLTVDYDSELIYWIDGRLLTLEVATFTGTNRKIIRSKVSDYPYALTHFQNRFYWTDWKTWSIHWYELGSPQKPKECTDINITLVPKDIKVWDKRKQPKHSHPCEVNNGGCSHLCLLAPYPPGYSCACPIGIKLKTNTTCYDGPQELLLVARRTDICVIYLDSPDYSYKSLPLHNVKYSIAIEYDPVDEFIYWSDDQVMKIQRARLNGSDQEDVISVDVQHPDGIAIDWVSRNLYWTDAGTNRIEMIRLNKGYRKVIISDGLVNPRAIAVAPEQGWLFWSDWNEKSPKIERSSTAGFERRIIISEDLGWPNGIALDYDNSRIYWGDAKLDRIEQANMDGSNRLVLINEQVPHVFGISMMGDFLYWTDWQRTAIDRAHKDSAVVRELIIERLRNIMGLKAIKLEPVKGFNNCSVNNGNCSQICLHQPNSTRICACEIDYEIGSDGVSCVIPNAFILYAKKDGIGRISLENKNNEPTVLPISGIKQASAIDFDITTKRIYWSDVKTHTIMRSFINGSEPQRIVELGLASPVDIAIDWLGLNIYWTDSVTHRIEVARVTGTSRRILIWLDIHEPHSLVLDPPNGYMYWSEWARPTCIKKAPMDGSKQEQIIQTNKPADSLTLDYDKNVLYWTESESSSIMSYKLKTFSPKYIIKHENHYRPLGLTLYQDYLYWSDENTGDVYRASKDDGSNVNKIVTLPDNATDLLVYTPVRPKGTNQCSTSNGGCAHLCLALPEEISKKRRELETFKCACPTHYTLEGNECKPPQEYMIYTQKNGHRNLAIELVPDDVSNCPETVLPIQGMKSVRAISFDTAQNVLYWIENKTHVIRKAPINGSSQSSIVVASDPSIHPYDLAVDTVGRLLFWTCANTNSINVTRLDNNIAFGVVLKRKGEEPRLLALHPTKRLLFYTDEGIERKLVRTRLDGSHRIIITKDIVIVDIAVDADNDLIIFAQEHSIYISNIDGENQHVLLNESNSRITQLTVHLGWLYWIDRELHEIQRLELTGKSRSTLPIQQASIIVDLISIVIPEKDNPCAQKHQNKCSHLCILNGTNPLCACPEGKSLQADKKICSLLPSCSSNTFSCNSRDSKDCIPITWRCDGQKDCSDGADEVDCPVCQNNQFKCNDGHCLEESEVCDGIPQCQDKADEANCCKNSFQCPHTEVCISFSLVCDGTDNCANGADEQESLCNTSSAKNTHRNEIIIISGVIIVAIWISLMVYCVHKKLTRNEIIQEQSEDLLNPIQSTLQAKAQGIRKGIPDVVRMSMLTGETSSYDRNHITGASSSTNSSSNPGCYPCETLNPPPSPATTRGSSSHSRYRPYRHYRSINQPPPPTPCSTDVCDESDYNYSTRSRYDGPFPPPPTPRSHCHSESCPPSPSSRSSMYFSPYPPPPSPVPLPTRGYDS